MLLCLSDSDNMSMRRMANTSIFIVSWKYKPRHHLHNYLASGLLHLHFLKSSSHSLSLVLSWIPVRVTLGSSSAEVSNPTVNCVTARNFFLEQRMKATAWSVAMAAANTLVRPRLQVAHQQKTKGMQTNSHIEVPRLPSRTFLLTSLVEKLSMTTRSHLSQANEEACHSQLLGRRHYRPCLRLDLLVIINWPRVQYHWLLFGR